MGQDIELSAADGGRLSSDSRVDRGIGAGTGTHHAARVVQHQRAHSQRR